MIPMLKTLCRERTDLSEEEIAHLCVVATQMQMTADLTGNDIFLDCLEQDGACAFVAAHVAPSAGVSLYESSVQGQTVLPALEPAVFHAVSHGVLVRDLKGVTQEGRSVRQDAIPVESPAGKVIGVMIREKDISESLSIEKKYKMLAQQYEKKSTALGETVQPDSAAMREVHHRVKNNLQMVASLLNLQAHSSDSALVRRTLQENRRRVLNIAVIHDMLTKTSVFDRVSVQVLLHNLVNQIAGLAQGTQCPKLIVQGDDLQITADCATSVALVVSELVSNAIEHAFPAQTDGVVTISISSGALYSTVTVQDNGVGFIPLEADKERMGLRIVRMTVQEKMRTDLRIASGEQGTTISFDLKTE